VSDAGFDTASSIALLGVSALAKKNTDGKPMPSSHIIILPVNNESSAHGTTLIMQSQLLFTAAMTLVDSVDSILMLYSYSGFPERSWIFFEKSNVPNPVVDPSVVEAPSDITPKPEHPQMDGTASLQTITDKSEPESSPNPDQQSTTAPNTTTPVDMNMDSRTVTDTRAKMNVMSGLSIVLTLMSILVAFR
jgi:high-affinity nickel-transport protein